MDNNELQNLVESISIEVFHKPFLHKATFNNRLRSTGGRYLLKTGNIELNKKYYEHFGKKELIGIIKHELCHYHLHLEGKGYKHRDKDFRLLLKQVGAPRFCSSLPGSRSERKSHRVLVYECKECTQVYSRKRKINTMRFVCGKCKGKLFLKNQLTL